MSPMDIERFNADWLQAWTDKDVERLVVTALDNQSVEQAQALVRSFAEPAAQHCPALLE